MPDRQVVDLLGAMRELAGDDITLGIDPGYRWTHWQEALWVLNRLDEHRIFFAEAPLRHDDIEGYRQLAARSPLLIGAAEFATGRYEAREWLETAKVPLLHCGVSRAGGFTEVTRISEMCELAGAMLMPHSYASAISDFANIHVQVASMQVPLIEFRTLEPVTDPAARTRESGDAEDRRRVDRRTDDAGARCRTQHGTGRAVQPELTCLGV